MEAPTEIAVYFILFLATVTILFGFVGIARRKISLHYRNHVWEGKGAVLLSIVLVVTGIGLLLSVLV